MEDRLDGGNPNLSSNERQETDDGRRPEITSSEIQILSNPAHRVTGGEIKEAAEMQTFDQRKEDHDKKNPNQDFPLGGLSVSDDVNSAETEALGSLCSAEPAEPEAQSSSCGDPAVQDHHGETLLCRQAMDLLSVTQRDEPQPVSDQQEAETGVDASSQVKGIIEEKAYHSVLHQMLQQQKHKPGRRFKKKTLMKMARLFVIAKGWKSGENKCLGSAKTLNPEGDLFTSQGRKQPAEGRREETSPSTCSTQAETFNKKRKRPETPGSDCEKSRNLPETPDTQHQRTSEPTAEEQNRVGEIRSVSDGEEPKTRRVSRGRTPKRRRGASKGTKTGGKTKDPSDQTSGPADRSEEETTINKKLGGSKDTELKSQVETSEGDGLSASSGGNLRKRRSSVRLLQPAEVNGQSRPDLFPLASADELTSCQSGDFVGQESREKVKKPRKRRSRQRRGADQLPTGNQDQTSLNPDAASLTKSDHQKPGKPQASTVWDSSSDQCVSAEMLLQREKLNPQKKRPGQKKMFLQITDENCDFKDQGGAFSLKREEDGQTKGPGRRERLKPDSGEKTLHFHMKSEADETDQLDFPLMDLKTVSSPTETQSYRMRKPRTRQYVGGVSSQKDEVMKDGAAGDEAGGSLESFISSVCGSTWQEERRKKVKPELQNPDETAEGTKCKEVEQRKVTERRKKRGRRRKQEPNPDVFTASGGQTGPTLETRSTLDQTKPLQTEGVDSAVKRAGRKRCRKNRRTSSSKMLTGLKILRSNEDDAGAPVDEEICKTSNVKQRRKRRDVFTMEVEDGASNVTDLTAVKEEPEGSKSTSLRQEESTTPLIPLSVQRKPRMKKRRRRCKTHWVNKTKAKRPQISSLQESPADSSLCDEILNVQPGDQEDESTVNPEPRTCESLQKEKKTLQCSFCLRCFRHISAFTLHRRIHTGEKPYGCSVCAKRFSRLSQLSLHSKVHDQPPAASCPCCGGTFRNKTELVLHFKVHLNEVESLQTNSEGSGRICSDSSRDEPFRCSVCSKESTFKTHRRRHREEPLGRRKMFSRSSSNEATSVSSDRGRTEVDGFLVSEGEDAEIVTPVFFKCSICKQLHRFWCHYVLHLQSHASARPYRCDACGQLYDQAAETRRHCLVCCKNSGEEMACRGSLRDIWKEAKAPEKEGVHSQPEQEDESSMFPQEPGEPSASESVPSMIHDFELHSPSPGSGSFPASNQTPRRSSTCCLQPLTLSGSRCGQMLAQWNKPWLHQRLHRRGRRAFRCSRCQLEFRFLGSYADHLQEHAAQAPHAWTDETDLNTHASKDDLKCNTCGKRFSSLMNLQKHKVLHKAGASHVCLPCSRSFSCHAALTAHLQAHRKRLGVPRPARVEEPFVFPYHCRKCTARFSSTDLLQAHQVCHFVAGKKPESSPERDVLFSPNIRRVPSESSQPKRQLPVSSKKHLFRYPHPDRLYVVPVVSSEPPVVVSDTEEETNDPHREPGDGLNPNTPEGSFVSERTKSRQLELLVRSLIPEKRANLSDSSDCESDATPPQKRHVQNCAMCTKTFTDVATLHEHYRAHARGV